MSVRVAAVVDLRHGDDVAGAVAQIAGVDVLGVGLSGEIVDDRAALTVEPAWPRCGQMVDPVILYLSDFFSRRPRGLSGGRRILIPGPQHSYDTGTAVSIPGGHKIRRLTFCNERQGLYPRP